MKRTYHKGEIAHTSMYFICLATVIYAIFFGFACTSIASDKGDTNLSESVAQSQANKEISISGIGHGELLLTFTVNKVVPVFSGRYSYDINGIHVPPISTPVQVESSNQKGYSYNLPNVYIPGKPNNCVITACRKMRFSIPPTKICSPAHWVLNRN